MEYTINIHSVTNSAWRNFIHSVERNDLRSWAHAIDCILRDQYNAVRMQELLVFKSDADRTMFLLRFS